MTDHRSAEALAYRHLYKSTAWRKGRLAFLSQQPLCERCLANGRTTPATVVNHRKPHKGDVVLFFQWENWEATCKPHHDSDIQSEERRGYSTKIGIDGYPVDTAHPANGGRPIVTPGLGPISHPYWFRPTFVPMTIVCGPPASGKTTYVANHKGQGDVVFDLDAIAIDLYKRPLSNLDSDQRIKCIKARNERMGKLMWAKAKGIHGHAWLIVSEPDGRKRQWWADKVKPSSIVVIETSAAECIARAKAQQGNGHTRASNVDQAIQQWWAEYTRREGDVVVRP